jgi:hypothetical protein
MYHVCGCTYFDVACNLIRAPDNRIPAGINPSNELEGRDQASAHNG